MNGKILAIILVAAAGYYGYEIYKAKQSKVTPVVTPKPVSYTHLTLPTILRV